MTKTQKFLLIMIIGVSVIMASGWLSGYWQELWLFAGLILITALITSVIIRNSKTSREFGAKIVFTTSLVLALVHGLTYGGHEWNHWPVGITCLIIGAVLTLIVHKESLWEKRIQMHEQASIARVEPR